jgi:predicted nucleic acid-binding protein
MTTFVDTNIIIYLLDQSSPFHGWARTAVTKRKTVGPLVISDIVYSEVSVSLNSVQETDVALGSLAVERLRFTTAALFRAGKAFAEYRARGGPKTSMLSDFLIGAQAETEGAPLMRANLKDYRSYFPTVLLIEPASPVP